MTPKGRFLVVASAMQLCLVGAAIACTVGLRRYDSAPTSTRLADVMEVPRGKWITVRGRPAAGTRYNPMLGGHQSRIRMMQLEGSPLVVLLFSREAFEDDDTDVKDMDLTGVLTDASAAGEVEFGHAMLDISGYCASKRVKCGSTRRAVLLVDQKPDPGILRVAAYVLYVLVIFLLLFTVGVATGLSKKRTPSQGG